MEHHLVKKQLLSNLMRGISNPNGTDIGDLCVTYGQQFQEEGHRVIIRKAEKILTKNKLKYYATT